MTITVDIKKEKVEAFYQMLKEYDWLEEESHSSILDSHLNEALLREQDPVMSQAQPWSEARQKNVGKGL